MPASSGIHVRGLDGLNRALRRSSRDVRLGIRKELREVAEPVRAEAEHRAHSEISGIARGRGRSHWERMRVGLSLAHDLIYVAPRQRGVKGRGADPRRRPNLADLMMGRAMEPALEHHQAQIEARVGRALDRISERWSL